MKEYEKAFQIKDESYRSSTLTNGLGKSGQRALLYATGMDEEDLKKPFVAVIGSFSEMVPGHVHLRELAEYVKQGIAEAGGVPRHSETIAICDGLCQGHKGMCYPLASRDLITDSIEMVVEAHHFDAMVLLPGCDKIIPGMLMAAARLNIPTIIVPGGPMLPGNVGGNPLFCSSELREYPGRVEAGIMTVDEMKEAEKSALPTVGSCAHLGTANSMCMLTEVLGMALEGAGTAPAVSNKRKRLAKASGRQVMELLRQNIKPRDILTRETLLNGIAGAMATGSSTNLVLHLMAIAHEAEVSLSLQDFDRISREIPFICNLQPSGKYPIVSLDASGGIPAVLKMIETKLHTNSLTVTGKTVKENLASVKAVADDVLRTMDNPQKEDGGIGILYGNLAPRGAVVKKSGVKPSMYYFKGKARVFNSMEEADAAISSDSIEKGTVIVIRYEGPKGGPGMREMLSTTALIMGRGMDDDCAIITDGRFSGATHGPCIGHISPEAAAGGPIAFVQDGDEIEIDINQRKLSIAVSDEEMAARKIGWQPLYKERKPALAKYASMVSSADTGAIIDVKNL
ncbi:dihydroxy-acid dehydratase [Gallibacterium salpingitidis]|uniref:Dihydroxy-acid dehydratase n=1 Tax=Gallibacterium salpingitidis TaxID=505341 RepID=A0A1A7P1L7_9PAST|nr:dihydroxy-acid dehydratase [Gallibacterium salpingitidis]OBW95636.1 dihydroxy-acid dehydratase [Gallibacterium salpingitidis]